MIELASQRMPLPVKQQLGRSHFKHKFSLTSSLLIENTLTSWMKSFHHRIFFCFRGSRLISKLNSIVVWDWSQAILFVSSSLNFWLNGNLLLLRNIQINFHINSLSSCILILFLIIIVPRHFLPCWYGIWFFMLGIRPLFIKQLIPLFLLHNFLLFEVHLSNLIYLSELSVFEIFQLHIGQDLFMFLHNLVFFGQGWFQLLLRLGQVFCLCKVP